MSSLPPPDLTATLAELESSLHDPRIRRNEAQINTLLHADFEEIGRSGKSWHRAAIIEMLLSDSSDVQVVADRYVATELQPGVALLTYRAAHRQADQSLTRHTLRSSIWVRVGEQWQMRFHQGTAAAEVW